jgi:hypothetical protein
MSLVSWDQKDFSDGLSQWIDAGNGDHPDDAALSDFGASHQEALLALFKCANEWGSYEGEVTLHFHAGGNDAIEVYAEPEDRYTITISSLVSESEDPAGQAELARLARAVSDES